MLQKTLLMLFLLTTSTYAFAQGQVNKRVTVNLTSASIYDFFDVVKHQTGLNFIMKSKDAKAKKITINEQNQPANEVIKRVLQQIGCTSEMRDGIVTVLPAKEQAVSEGRHISGTVVFEEDGTPVIGATVKIVGTKDIVVTDIDGKFSFHSDFKKGQRVQISFMGMQTANVVAGPKMRVALKSDAKKCRRSCRQWILLQKEGQLYRFRSQRIWRTVKRHRCNERFVFYISIQPIIAPYGRNRLWFRPEPRSRNDYAWTEYI